MNVERGTGAQYCLDLVKTNDLDRYLSTLLAPKDKHRSLLAIYAFDTEICSIAGQVSEPAIGEIRLQWWRDALDTLYGQECDNHPIAIELHAIVHRYDLPKHLFTKLIDAHQFDLYKEAMINVESLENYQRATSGAITALVCRVLIGDDVLEIEHLIEKAGIAHGLAKILSQLPKQSAQGKCFIPFSLLQKYNLEVSNVLARENSRDTHLVITQLRLKIIRLYEELRREQGRLSKAVLPAFFPTSLAAYKFSKNLSSSRNLLERPITLSQLKMQWFLFKKSLFEQI